MSRTQAARDLWWNKLNEVLATEREKEPCSTNIQVVYFDLNTSIEYCKTFSVGPEETARDCIKLALEHLEMRGLDPAHFQLWAKTAREEAPYPLIGHERPFAIKLSCLREGLSSEEGFDLDHCNNVHDPLARCHFILRSTCKPSDSETKKSGKKSSGRMRIGQVFRRSLSKDNSGCLFGLPLAKICEGDNLPRPVMAMLQQVFAKGPFTQGIFRKSANARLVRELRDKLDNGEEVTWEHVPVLVTAALLKDFLRSLPDPLLTSNLYPQWKSALDTPNTHHKLLRLKGVLQQLPKPNHTLLSHFLCVLHHISRRSSQNLMSAANLGVCVGPSLLWSDVGVVGEELRAIPSLVECLITHCQVLCGTHVPHLLGDPRDSGTEESDSLRRDDSSIDSLECSPPPRKDKMSLSRDSGLTMSDSQLYTPDEEESGSTSSSGYDPAFDPHTKVTPSLSVPGEYVRVYGGWEERLNPNFQRQAWFRQRSRRLSSVTPNNKSIEEAVRRSASEESLLDTQPPPTPPRRAKPEVLVPDVPKTIPEVVHTPRKSSEPLKPSDMNGKCGEIIVNQDCVENFKTELTMKPSIRDITTSVNFSEDKFGRHPPLRKVTAVHCEVVSDQSSRTQFKENNQSAVYGVNGVKKLSLSSAELSYNSAKSLEQSFVSVRSGDVSYSPQRIQESYRSAEQSFSRSLDQSFSTPTRVSENYNQSPRSNHSPRSNQSPRSNDSPRQNRVVSEQNYESPKLADKTVLGFGAGDYYYAVREDIEEVRGSECDDSSTLSDDDCTPHVSRSNSRGNEVTTKLRHLPPVHVDTCFVRGRLKRKEERAAHRSRSLPPPPPYRPPPPANTQNRRAPITSYYLGDCSQSQRYVVTRTFMDEESYV